MRQGGHRDSSWFCAGTATNKCSSISRSGAFAGESKDS